MAKSKKLEFPVINAPHNVVKERANVMFGGPAKYEDIWVCSECRSVDPVGICAVVGLRQINAKWNKLLPRD